MLFDVVPFLQQFHPPVPCDPMCQVDDEVAGSQVQERVDDLSQTPPGRAADFRSLKELVAGENDQTVFHRVEACAELPTGKMEPLLARGAGIGENVGQPFDFRLGGADDDDVPFVAYLVELLADACARSPPKRSTDSMPGRQVVSKVDAARADAVTEGQRNIRSMTAR